MQSVGKAIKEYRDKNHLTQEKFGELVGVNKQTVSKWEKEVIQPSIKKYFEIEQIIGNLVDNEKSFIYEKKIEYNVGLNYLFENIHDYYSLYMFLDSLVVAHDLLGKTDHMGFMLFDETYEAEIYENILHIISIELYEDFILLKSSDYDLHIYKDAFFSIEKDERFNNESYVINCFAEEDREHFIQLIVEFENY